MTARDAWNEKARNILKAELARLGIFSFHELQAKLAAIGIEETAGALNVKINRGKFSFAFFMQCMEAIGLKDLHLRLE